VGFVTCGSHLRAYAPQREGLRSPGKLSAAATHSVAALNAAAALTAGRGCGASLQVVTSAAALNLLKEATDDGPTHVVVLLPLQLQDRRRSGLPPEFAGGRNPPGRRVLRGCRLLLRKMNI
jgi:hypothetical protein